jgi:hypothetical protein
VIDERAKAVRVEAAFRFLRSKGFAREYIYYFYAYLCRETVLHG